MLTHNFDKKKCPGKSMTEIELHHRIREVLVIRGL